MSLASSKKRILSFIIDDLVITFILFFVFFGELQGLDSPEEIQNFMEDNILSIMFLKVSYHTILIWHNGMTIGKYFMKIKVVGLNGYEDVSFGVAFIRGLFRLVSEFIFYLGFVMAFFVPQLQTLHDKIAGTLVVDA